MKKVKELDVRQDMLQKILKEFFLVLNASSLMEIVIKISNILSTQNIVKEVEFHA